MMKKIMAGVALAALLSVSAPADAREKEATTPSGRSEMVFGYTALADAVVQVQSKCMDKGWMVASQTPNQVVCEIPMGVFQSALTQMLVGNSYSSTPKMFTRFSLAQVGEHTRVQTQTWAETQMVFGQMQQQQYTDDGTYNNMLGFLAESGAQFPVGTTFTARAYLGVNGEDGTWMNGRRSTYGYRLKQVVVGAPAYRWGVREGDVVTKVNNRTFRDDEGMSAMLNRQRVGQPMTMSVIRDGQEMTFTGPAEGRPTTTLLVSPAQIPPGETAVGLQLVAALRGGVEPALADYRAAHPQWNPVAAAPAATAAVAPGPESDLDRMRREAAEAQARLAEAEAKAATSTPTAAPQ